MADLLEAEGSVDRIEKRMHFLPEMFNNKNKVKY